MSYFTVDKGIYQRSKFEYKWVRFIIYYFSGGFESGRWIVSGIESTFPDTKLAAPEAT